MESPEPRYQAFISYSHRDAASVEWLHRALEAFHIPRRLIGRRTSAGTVPARLFPIFRDRDELAGAPQLGPKIEEALRSSRTLLVVCSPAAAASRWVNEEIRCFREQHGDARIFSIIVEGEPPACFPPALLADSAEPLAADARREGDGRAGALLKIVAGMLDVGYDELRQRERQRVRARRARLLAACMLLATALLSGYVVMADRGFEVPGAEAIRAALDHYGLINARPVHGSAETNVTASRLRRAWIDALLRMRTEPDSPWYLKFAGRGPVPDVWTHCASLSAIFRSPETSSDDVRKLLPVYEVPFQPQLAVVADGVPIGWLPSDCTYTQAEPALWTAAAGALATSRGGSDATLRDHAYYAQRVARAFISPVEGGWNILSRQRDPRQVCTYTAAIALLALLETRDAALPWDGSVENRDRLLRDTARWLGTQFEPGGWRFAPREGEPIDGLTLQIAAELLRAEEDAGVAMPPQILAAIPNLLKTLEKRGLDYPNQRAVIARYLTDHTGQQIFPNLSIELLWYPWAIDLTNRWMRRCERDGTLTPALQVRLQRLLGHLVVDLGPQLRVHDIQPYKLSEALYALSAVRTP